MTEPVPQQSPAHDPPSNDVLADCLARCSLGDRRALAHLYHATAPKLFAVAVRILKKRDVAEDTLQEAFVRIWQHAREYRPERGAAMAWMARIVRNAALDRRRRFAHERVVDGEDVLPQLHSPDAGPAEHWGQSKAARALADCLAQLDDRQSQSIVLAYCEGLSHAELAAQLREPLGTIKSWIRRGLDQLKKCLEP